MSWQAAIERTVSGMGYELVDVERLAGGLLRVTLDRLPGKAYAQPGEFVTVEDCEAVTRQLQHLLLVEGCDYSRLEVSSPGLDRPLRRPSDWQRFAGSEVELTLRMPFQGRKRWRGMLRTREDGGWRLELPPAGAAVVPKGRAKTARSAATGESGVVQVLDFSLDEVREAHLVPVVDFKGRGRSAAPAAAQADPAAVNG